MTDQRITDFAVWDIQDEFTPNEAAYLWLGLEPNHAIGGHPAKVISLSNTLYSEVKKGALPARQGDPRLWECPYIKRESLKAWEERKGQRPLFLFPDDRPSSSTDLLSKDAQRLPIVLDIAKGLGLNPLDIPRGGKTKLRDEAMRLYPGKITQDIFEQIWDYGKREGQLKIRKL